MRCRCCWNVCATWGQGTATSRGTGTTRNRTPPTPTPTRPNPCPLSRSRVCVCVCVCVRACGRACVIVAVSWGLASKPCSSCMRVCVYVLANVCTPAASNKNIILVCSEVHPTARETRTLNASRILNTRDSETETQQTVYNQDAAGFGI